jgi:hypothetical protein
MKKIIIPMIAVLSITTMSTLAASNDIKTDNNNVSKSYMNKIKESKKKEDSVEISDDYKKEKQLISDAIQTAVKANDYEAFVKAFVAEQAKIMTPTKEQFTKMVEKHKEPKIDEKYNAIQIAIKNNDYQSFITAFKTISEKVTVPTEIEFAKMVEQSTKHNAIQSAIKANDYDAFVKAFEANKPIVPTKEEFTKIVELQKTIKEEKKEGTITKEEAKTKIVEIKKENEATKKVIRLAKRPMRKVSRLSK